MSFEVCTFRHAKSARPDLRRISWPALRASLTRFRPVDQTPYLCVERGCYGSRAPLDAGPCPKCGAETSAKLGTACWSPATYPPGVNRGRSRVLAVSCLVLDYDDGTTIEAARQTWERWPAVLHTSWSHSDEHHKFRVTLPLLRPVVAAGWPRVFQWALDQAPTIDTQCKDPSRIYFVPSHPIGAPERAEVWKGAGAMLDLDPAELSETPEEYARRTRKPPKPVQIWSTMTPTQARRQLSERIKTDEHARRAIADRLGAVISEGATPRADRIPCPSCGRPSVHYLLIPGSWNGARCSHRESCGWAGWVDQLIEVTL